MERLYEYEYTESGGTSKMMKNGYLLFAENDYDSDLAIIIELILITCFMKDCLIKEVSKILISDIHQPRVNPNCTVICSTFLRTD